MASERAVGGAEEPRVRPGPVKLSDSLPQQFPMVAVLRCVSVPCAWGERGADDGGVDVMTIGESELHSGSLARLAD